MEEFEYILGRHSLSFGVLKNWMKYLSKKLNAGCFVVGEYKLYIHIYIAIYFFNVFHHAR